MPYKDPAKRVALTKQWRAANREKCRQWSKKDRLKNIEKYRADGWRRAKTYRDRHKVVAETT